MRNVLMIAPVGIKWDVIGGAIAKNRNIYRYYQINARVYLIDTYWERRSLLQYVYYKYVRKVLLLPKIAFLAKTVDAVIIGSNDDSNIRVLRLFKALGKASLFAIGGMVPDRIKKSVYDVSLWNSLKRIYVESYEMEKELEKMGLENARFLRNFKFLPCYSSVYRHNDGETIELFYHGRICKDKGMDCLMEAMRIVNREKVRARLFLYGTFEEKWSIPEDVMSYVFYKGKLDLVNGTDDYERLYKHDVFVFPSKWKAESLSSSVQDALAVGKPVIASRHNLNEKMVIDGYNGLIFGKDNHKELADCIMKLYFNRDLIDIFGNNSLKEADKYRIESVLSEVDLYG